MIKIVALTEKYFKPFFKYLNQHISENKTTSAQLFLPLTRAQSQLDSDWKKKFECTLKENNQVKNWRKMWIALNPQNKIVGHIDIRPHGEANTQHRVLLGMGVHCDYRNQKIGQQLIEHIIEYSKNNPGISWIDLHVLTNNQPAIALYEKMKFHKNGLIVDMFRIDHNSYDYTSMTLNVG